MIELLLKDSAGTELKLGDLVKMSQGTVSFYSQVQVWEGTLYPFQGFIHNRCEKIDSLPEGVTESPREDLPRYWINFDPVDLDEDDHDWLLDMKRFHKNRFFSVREAVENQVDLFGGEG